MKTAEQIAQHISDDFMLDLDGRVALSQAIKEALTGYADEQNRDLMKSLHLEVSIENMIKRNARAEPLEEAAKIASEFDGGSVNRPYEWIAVRSGIALKIRTLKDKAAE